MHFVGIHIDFPFILAKQGLNSHSLVLIIPISDAKVAEYLRLQALQTYLWVSKDDIVVIVSDSPLTLLQVEVLLLGQGHQNSWFVSSAAWTEGGFAISCNEGALVGLYYKYDIGLVIDVVMEICLIGWVKFVEHPGTDYFSVMELFDCLFKEYLFVGIVIQGISRKQANNFKLFLSLLEFWYILETDFDIFDEFFFRITCLLLHSRLSLLVSAWVEYSIESSPDVSNGWTPFSHLVFCLLQKSS